MQIANLPLATGYTTHFYYSDDVDKDTRWHGFFLDLKRTEEDAYFIVSIVSNSKDRIAEIPGTSEVFWRHRIGKNNRPIKQKENPILVTLDSPIFVPGGVTLLVYFSTSDHVDPLSVNVFVER